MVQMGPELRWNNTMPGGPIKHNRELEPTVHIDPVMIAKILTKNGQILHMPMCCALAWEDYSIKETKDKHWTFIQQVHLWLEPQTMMKDLIDLCAEEIPPYDPYEGISQKQQPFHSLEKEQEKNSNWDNTEALLPGRVKMMRGCIKTILL